MGRKSKVSLWLSLALIVVGAAIMVAPRILDTSTLELEETSAYSRIRIKRKGDVRTLLFVRDSGQEVVESRVNLVTPYELLLPYTRTMFASYLYKPKQSRVLIVGLGGGAMVHFLRHHEPEVTVDVVEIDPVVVRLADEYFNVRSDEKTNIFTQDGFEYLEATQETYDVIYMDAFLKPSRDTDRTGVPERLKTMAFYKSVQSKLSSDGMVVFNLNIHWGMEEDISTLREAFLETYLFECPGSRNLVAVCTMSVNSSDAKTLEARASEMDKRFMASFSFRDVLRARRR